MKNLTPAGIQNGAENKNQTVISEQDLAIRFS
jgi:hypothetical protein